jgi:DNA-binding MarR family transcriptional regulator
MEPQRLSPSEYEALADFRYELRHFLRFSERAARASGLEPQEYQLLLAVKGTPTGRRATVALLAEQLQIGHRSTADLVTQMESRDLVRRVGCADGREEISLELTAHAEALLPLLATFHCSELRSAAPVLLRTLELLLDL